MRGRGPSESGPGQRTLSRGAIRTDTQDVKRQEPVERFVRRGTYCELLGPLTVGRSERNVEYEDAPAGTVAS